LATLSLSLMAKFKRIMPMSSLLEFQNITKKFGDMTVVDNVSFSINNGEFFSLLGPSGCGKTTLLRIAAGLESPDSGRVILNGQDITDLPPNRRPVNTVFQNYALFPHLSVWDNIAFGLKVKKRSSQVIDQEVGKMLQLIQMEEHAHKKPSQISGGQKQRVAIARALVNHPDLLLLDEPLSALDLKLRQKMLMEIDLIHDEVGIIFLFVTHDQTEAMAVSDRIAVMHHGKVEQIGTPMELYEAPKSSFVAAFIGDTNFLDGKVTERISDEYSLLDIDGLSQPIRCYNDKKIRIGELIHTSIRPEKMHITRKKPKETSEINLFEGTVEDIIYKGDHTKYWVRVDDLRLAIMKPNSRFILDRTEITWGEKVWVWWHEDDSYMLERYSETDTNMTELPSEAIGEVEEHE